MALYGSMGVTAVTSTSGLPFGVRTTENKRMLVGQFTPTSITTTINTGMRTVDSVIMTFVSIPSGTHNENHYTASTNGAVRITHLFARASVSATSTFGTMNYATATATWSRLSYMIVGSEEHPVVS